MHRYFQVVAAKTLPVAETATEWSSKLFPNLVIKQARTHGAMILPSPHSSCLREQGDEVRVPVTAAGVTSLGEMCEFNPGQRERNSPKDSLETFLWGLCWVFDAAQAFL